MPSDTTTKLGEDTTELNTNSPNQSCHVDIPPSPPSYNYEELDRGNNRNPHIHVQGVNNNWGHLESDEPLLNNHTDTHFNPDLPPPYNPNDFNAYPSAPPYAPVIMAAQPGYMNRSQQPQQSSDEPKEDLDLFRYAAPCKKVATFIGACVGLVVLLVVILLLVYGKL